MPAARPTASQPGTGPLAVEVVTAGPDPSARPMEPRPSIDAVPTAGPGNHAVPDTDGVAPLPATDGVAPLPATNGAAHPPGSGTVNGVERATCTAPQLRRFIKSRPWIPLHELRRRFSINGAEDDVTAVEVDGRTVFVGLPAREGVLLGELLRGGEIGYELSLDPGAPIVIGVYPMRPVPRQ